MLTRVGKLASMDPAQPRWGQKVKGNCNIYKLKSSQAAGFWEMKQNQSTWRTPAQTQADHANSAQTVTRDQG